MVAPKGVELGSLEPIFLAKMQMDFLKETEVCGKALWVSLWLFLGLVWSTTEEEEVRYTAGLIDPS